MTVTLKSVNQQNLLGQGFVIRVPKKFKHIHGKFQKGGFIMDVQTPAAIFIAVAATATIAVAVSTHSSQSLPLLSYRRNRNAVSLFHCLLITCRVRRGVSDCCASAISQKLVSWIFFLNPVIFCNLLLALSLEDDRQCLSQACSSCTQDMLLYTHSKMCLKEWHSLIFINMC